MHHISSPSTPTGFPEASDAIDPFPPSEPSSPPRAYDPYSASRSDPYQHSGQTTAVNSVIHLEGVISKPMSPSAEIKGDQSPSKLEAAGVLPVTRGSLSMRIKDHFMAEIDPHFSSIPLAAYCFMTGYTDAITYIAAYVSSAFQTGNTIMAGMAIAKQFTRYPHALVNLPTAIPEDASWSPDAAAQWSRHRDHSLSPNDTQALVSLVCFLIGALSGRIGDRIGTKRRVWLFSGTIIGALLTLAAAICSWANHQSSFAAVRGSSFVNWSTPLGYLTIGFASCAMGIQAFTGMRIGNAFNSTIVFTLLWIQLICDPKLFKFGQVPSRDHRAIAILSLTMGG
ncbi:unnamed protein product [Rhizoctonia solani]|uniref:Uncharacterized protein n=1 Tax=Rhizoctonia solani TaxID=456999 RepID=A0A8H3H908_9AGAM|nr:unnamed protein product [Rhizoctonia solani]